MLPMYLFCSAPDDNNASAFGMEYWLRNDVMANGHGIEWWSEVEDCINDLRRRRRIYDGRKNLHH